MTAQNNINSSIDCAVSLHSKLDSISNILSGLDSRISGIENKLNNLENKISEINNLIDSLENVIITAIESVKSIIFELINLVRSIFGGGSGNNDTDRIITAIRNAEEQIGSVIVDIGILTVNQVSQKVDNTKNEIIANDDKNTNIIIDYLLSEIPENNDCEEVKQSVLGLAAAIAYLKAELNIKFDSLLKLENLIGELKVNVDFSRDKISNISNTTNNIDGKVTGIVNTVNNIDNNVTNVQNTTNNIDNRVTNIQNTTNNIDNNVTNVQNITNNIDNRVTNVQNITNNIDDRVTNVQNTTNNIDNKVTNVQNTTNNIDNITNNINNTTNNSQEKVAITVPVFVRCDEDENLEFSTQKIDVFKGVESEALLYFSRLAEFESKQCILLRRVGAFPALVPDLVTKDSPENKRIRSLAEYIAWFFIQMDALIGQFPFKIKVEDADLTEQGNQEQEIKIPNVAEALAELLQLGLLIRSETDAGLNIGLKNLIQCGQTKVVGQIIHDLALANAEFLGYKLKQKTVDFPMLFTPGKEKLDEVLVEQEDYKIKTYENEDTKDINDLLIPILELAAMWKAQNFRNIGTGNTAQKLLEVLGNASQFVKDLDSNNDPSKPNPENFDKFVEEAEQGFITQPGITDNIRPYGKDLERRPRIREIGNDPDAT